MDKKCSLCGRKLVVKEVNRVSLLCFKPFCKSCVEKFHKAKKKLPGKSFEQIIASINIRDPEWASVLTRFVPVDKDKLRRFMFTNIWLEPGQPKKLTLKDGRTTFEAVLQLDGNRILLRTKQSDVYLNNQPLTGEPYLSQGDRITLQKGKISSTYEFQSDPILAKAKRREQEIELGVQHRLSDLSGNKKLQHEFNNLCRIDENHIGIKGKGEFDWNQLDQITFYPSLGTPMGPLEGLKAGLRVGSVSSSDQTLSETELVLTAPLYEVRLWYRDTRLALKTIGNPVCILIANAIENFASMDLAKL